MNIPAGTSYTETRRVDGKLVRMDIETVADLFLDPKFHDGLFLQAAADGKSTYTWDFGNGDVVRMTVEEEARLACGHFGVPSARSTEPICTACANERTDMEDVP